MAADAAENAGIELATPGADTLAALDAVLPANWSHGNPVDIIGDAPVARYVDTLRVLDRDPQAGAILFIHAPTAIVPSQQIAQALLPLVDPKRPRLLSCWLGEAAVAQARQCFQDAGIASYGTPEEAVSAFSMLVRYRRNQAQLLEAPASHAGGGTQAAPDRAAVQSLLESVLAQGRQMLTEPQAKAVLDAYRIPVVATRVVSADADDAASAAQAIGFPVVLKVLSNDISHKSDVGGVVLNLAHAAAVRDAASAMLARIVTQAATGAGGRLHRAGHGAGGARARAHRGRQHRRGVRPGDPVRLGRHLGGDRRRPRHRVAAAEPPAGPRTGAQSTRIARLLDGYRDTPAADLDALDDVLVAVSQLMADHPQITELDINPLIVSPDGAIALDARIRVDARRAGGADHFAIKPYPEHLAEHVVWQGRELLVRPIRPGDEAQHLAFLRQLDPEDVRMRVFYSRRSIEASELARLTQIDYEREIAFIAERAGPDGSLQTLAAARAVTDPDNISAEFGIIVRSDLKGQGLGRLMMDKLIRTLRAQGTQRLMATVLHDNRRMLALQRDLGFAEIPEQADDGTRAIALNLQSGADNG